jgi:Domain of unknown function (DUF6895)
VSRWNEADLEARLCRALEVARKTLNYFAINGYTDKESPIHTFGPDKPVAETVMLIYAASACGHRPNVASRVDELARLLAPHVRSERVLVDIALHPALALKFAVPHVLLTRLGYRDAGFDDFLRSCISSHARNGHDRPPSASLERRWISSLWTGSDADAGWRADLLDSVLNWPIDILGGLRTDAYAFTHLIFYCTDFGFQTRRLPRRRSIILEEAASLLARYVDAEDYDLAGEILLAWPLTGAPWSPSAAFGFRVLASVEDQVGVLPSGSIDLSRLTELKGEERARYALGNAYHTAYIMGFLCAASLRPGRVPPTKIVGPRCEKSCLSRLLCYVDDDQGHWQSEFSSLAEGEQRVLTPLILDIAIMQKCRRHDYEAVSEILSLACDYRIANSPMCRQAAELLERIANCSTAIRLSRGAVTRDGVPPITTTLLSGSGRFLSAPAEERAEALEQKS